MPTLQADTVREYLHYDPASGIFTWVKSPARKIRIGSRAGYSSVNGYRALKLRGQTVLEHRLAYLYMEGRWPDFEIDHRNRVRADNRWDNLRPAQHHENHQNRGIKPRQFQPGARPTKGGRWYSRIKLRGRTQYLGTFDTEVEAGAAYLKAKENLHPFLEVR